MTAPERPVTEAMLFDLDGTLLDHVGAATAALREWLPTVGLRPSPAEIDRWFEAEEAFGARWRAGEISWTQQRRLRLRSVVPRFAFVEDADLDTAFDAYLQRYESHWTAYDDVAPALAEVAETGLRLAVLTNGSTSQQTAKLTAVGLLDRFEFLLTAEDLGLGKPDPKAFAAACRRFDLPARAVLHVGDEPELDVAAARAAGLGAVLIDRTGRHADDDALRSMLELRARVGGGCREWDGDGAETSGSEDPARLHGLEEHR